MMDTPNYYSASDKFQSERTHKEVGISWLTQVVVVQEIFLSLLCVQGKHNQLRRNNQSFMSVISERFTQATDNKKSPQIYYIVSVSCPKNVLIQDYTFSSLKNIFILKLGFCVQLCSP